MSEKISINVDLDATGVVRGSHEGAEALGDLEDAAQDISRDGARDLDRLEDSLKRVGRSGRDAGDDLKRGFDKGSQGVEDFKSESQSTLRETAASISSVEDGLDAVQEIAANAFQGFGPVGAGAGLVGALGLGLVTEEIRKQKEASDELRDALTGAYKEAAEEGRNYLTEAQIQAQATVLLFEDRARLQDEANRIGVDSVTLARAYAGSEEDAKLALEAGKRALEERMQVGVEEYGAQQRRLNAGSDEVRLINQVNRGLQEQLTWHRQNQEAAEDVNRMRREGAAQEQEQIQRGRDAEQARYEAMAERYRKPIKQTIEVEVDDRAWREYVPPIKEGRIRAGRAAI